MVDNGEIWCKFGFSVMVHIHKRSATTHLARRFNPPRRSSKLGFLLRFYSVFWKSTMKSESWSFMLWVKDLGKTHVRIFSVQPEFCRKGGGGWIALPNGLWHFFSEYEPLLRNQICIIFHHYIPWFTSEYHLRIMFDHSYCQNVHSQSQNRCFKEFANFRRKIPATKRPFAWGGGA